MYPAKLRPEKKRTSAQISPGPNAAERAVGPFGKQRQDNEGHDPEPHARSESDIVNPFHERVQPGFLDEQQGGERDDPAREADGSDAREHAGCQHHEGRDLCRAIDVLTAGRDVRRRHDRDGTREQDGRWYRDAGDPQPSTEPADGAQHRKRANTGKMRARSFGMAGPLTLEPNGRAA